MITRNYYRYRHDLPPWWAFWRRPKMVVVEKKVQTWNGRTWE